MTRAVIVVALLVLAALTSTSGTGGDDLARTPCASLPSAMRALAEPPGLTPRCAP